MHKNLGKALIVISLGAGIIAAWTISGLHYWIKPPHEKLLATWSEDIKLLEKSKQLPPEWTDIGNIVINSDMSPNSPVEEWLSKIHPPIKSQKQGRFKLETDIYFLIDGVRYGVVIQYRIVNIRTNNIVREFGRTYKLGFLY